MARNFLKLAAVFGLCALVAGLVSLLPSTAQPGLPLSGSPWRAAALVAVVLALIAALFGVMIGLFEQVDRRNEERRLSERERRRAERRDMERRSAGGQSTKP